MDSENKFKKNLLSSFYTKFFITVLAFFINILLARALGPEKLGQLTYILLIINLAAEFSPLGIFHSLDYYLKKSKFSQNEMISTNINFAIVLSFLAFFLLFLIKNFFPHLINYENKILLVCLLLFFSLMLEKIIFTYYIVEENIKFYNKYYLLFQLLQYFLIFILFLSKKLTISFYLYLYFGINFMTNIFFFSKSNLNYKLVINYLILKKQLSFGIILFIGALFSALIYRIDQILIKYFLNYSALGIYALAVSLGEKIFLIPQSIISSLTGRLYNEKELYAQKELMENTLRRMLYLIFFIILIAILFSYFLPYIYGNEYKASIIPFIIILFATIGASIGKISYTFFIVHGKPSIHTLITSITLILNVLLNIILLPYYGINGAAFSSFFSYSVYGLLYLFFLKKYKFSLSKIFIIQKSDINLSSVILKKILKK